MYANYNNTKKDNTEIGEENRQSPWETGISWRDAPPVLYEKRLVPVFDIAAGVACLFTAFTAMTMGHLYWYLFLLFYAHRSSWQSHLMHLVLQLEL